MDWRPPSPPRSTIAAAFILLLVPGCGDSLPSAPSQLTTGIVVYEHDHFHGQSAHITQNISDLSDFTGPCEHIALLGADTSYNWSDCMSSVRVAPGWRATLYRDSGYGDDSLEITGDVPNLERVPGHCSKGGLGDCVSSVRVRMQ